LKYIRLLYVVRFLLLVRIVVQSMICFTMGMLLSANSELYITNIVFSLCLKLERFIRSEEDDLDSSWEQRLAKRYHDKLFKEYP
jgi:hypothetical protein